MPVDRGLAVDLAENVTTLYQQAETRLAADLARRLASGMGSPTWAEDKLRGLSTLRQFSQNLVGRLNGAMAEEVAQATILAYVRGGTAALDDLGRAQSTHPEWLRLAGVSSPNDRLRAMIDNRRAGVAAQLAQARRALPGADAIARLAFNLTTKLQGAHLRIARWDLDAYREVVAAGSAPDVLLGLATRRRASQVAWERLLSGGITGFVDKSGRGWNLASYVEMATRSTVAQAAVEGHLDRLSAAGLDLVIVSNAPQECEKCRPWEGKILTRKGPDGKRTVQVEHGTRDGEQVDVDVAGSVDEAISAGLMHPNCRHSLSAYLAGVTRIPTNTEDPEGDKARQQLRALERKVRGQKLKAENTIDPAAKAGLEAKVRATQGQIREHVKATGLHRQPTREQIDLGHRPPPGPVASAPPPPAPAPTPPAPVVPAPAPAPAPKSAPKPAPAPAPKPVAKKAAPAKQAAKPAPPPSKAVPAKKAMPVKETAPRETTPPPPPKKTAPATPTPPQPPAPALPVAPPAEVPRGARPFHRDLNGVEDLANAVENGRPERSRRALTGGVSAETELVTLRDGTRVVHKYGGNPTAEQGAALIARALGLDAPRVYRNDRSSAWMDFVDNAESAAEVAVRQARAGSAGDQTSWRAEAVASDDGRRIGLLDLLIANGDRNVGNWMLPREGGRVIPIDHGHAFPSALSSGRRLRAQSNPGSPFAEHFHDGQTWQPNDFTPADIVEVRRRLTELLPDFEHFDQPRWIEYALVVLDVLEPHAVGTRNLIAGVG